MCEPRWSGVRAKSRLHIPARANMWCCPEARSASVGHGIVRTVSGPERETAGCGRGGHLPRISRAGGSNPLRHRQRHVANPLHPPRTLSRELVDVPTRPSITLPARDGTRHLGCKGSLQVPVIWWLRLLAAGSWACRRLVANSLGEGDHQGRRRDQLT